MKSLLSTLFLILLLASNSNGQNVWTTLTGSPTGATSIAAGAGLFVTVGATGNIYSSPDGINWTSRSSTLSDFDAVTFGQNLFVAAGYSFGGPNVIMTSPDGITWTLQPSTGIPTFVRIRSLTTNGTLFVAVGYNNATLVPVIYTSTNGQIWTLQNSSATAGNPFLCVKYGNGIFLAVHGTGNIFISSDGSTWTLAATTPGISIINNDGLSFASGLFMIASANGGLSTSDNGTAWAIRNTNTTNTLLHATWGNNTYVVTGVGGFISTTPDFVTWTVQTSGTTNPLSDIVFSNNTFVASSPSASNNIVISTTIPLPLNLIAFSGKVTHNRNELYWTTATEATVRSFKIQYSSDAKIFNTLESVNAKEENKRTQQYSYTDMRNTTTSTTYYRLVITDNLNNETISPVIQLNNTSTKALKIESVFGSPFNNNLTIGITTVKQGKAIVRLLDMKGTIAFETNIYLQAGTSIQQLSALGNLASGQYILQIIQGSTSNKIKVVKE